MVPLNVIYLRFICQCILFSVDLHFSVTVSLQSGISILIKKKSSFATVIFPFMEKEDVAVPDYQLPCQRIVQAVFGFIHMLNSVFMKELKKLPHYSSFTKCYETVPYDWTGLHCVLYF